jgi:hypothetical protein
MCSQLKLFISYSHADKSYIDDFHKHIFLLKKEGLIKTWYDREIEAGIEFQSNIDNNLNSADIICLCMSANFISSSACQKEIDYAFKCRLEEGTRVIPIILKSCEWLEIKKLSKLEALPMDGTPISLFEHVDDGWVNVYNEIKKVILSENKIRALKFTDEFSSLVDDSVIFSKAHKCVEKVRLSDIFVYPELDTFDIKNNGSKVVESDFVLQEILNNEKIVIMGEDQSGKTSLAKMLTQEFFLRHYLPIYLSPTDANPLLGSIDQIVKDSFARQYPGFSYTDFDSMRIVPIIDDFHKVKNKEKVINDLSKFTRCVLFADYNIGIDIKDDILLDGYKKYKIKEFKPSLLNRLISKWVALGVSPNEIGDGYYKEVDAKTTLVLDSLGKFFGKGIMPTYPFFILSIVSSYDTLKPLKDDITSQGYCYQFLITYFLIKNGVKSKDFDFFINFLSEFAYYLYSIRRSEISVEEMNAFYDKYEKRFNSKDRVEFLHTLTESQILLKSSLNNYSFYYPYIYYYFCGRYFADNLDKDDIKEVLSEMINNLHVNEYAYIVIFISHHIKNDYFQNMVKNVADDLFKQLQPASLSFAELASYDKHSSYVFKAAIPIRNNIEAERSRELTNRDKLEEMKSSENLTGKFVIDFEKDEYAILLRRCIKTVQVIGHIIKNRSGSLELKDLKAFFRSAMNVHLRVLTNFFNLIKADDSQNAIIEILALRINDILKSQNRKIPEDEKLTELARDVFWKINFMVVFGLMDAIVHSLCSEALNSLVIREVCEEVDSPASQIVNFLSQMRYNKHMDIEHLKNMFEDKSFSELAKNILKVNIVDYSRVNRIDFKDRGKLNSIFGFSGKELHP